MLAAGGGAPLRRARSSSRCSTAGRCSRTCSTLAAPYDPLVGARRARGRDPRAPSTSASTSSRRLGRGPGRVAARRCRRARRRRRASLILLGDQPFVTREVIESCHFGCRDCARARCTTACRATPSCSAARSSTRVPDLRGDTGAREPRCGTRRTFEAAPPRDPTDIDTPDQLEDPPREDDADVRGRRPHRGGVGSPQRHRAHRAVPAGRDDHRAGGGRHLQGRVLRQARADDRRLPRRPEDHRGRRCAPPRDAERPRDRQARPGRRDGDDRQLHGVDRRTAARA